MNNEIFHTLLEAFLSHPLDLAVGGLLILIGLAVTARLAIHYLTRLPLQQQKALLKLIRAIRGHQK